MILAGDFFLLCILLGWGVGRWRPCPRSEHGLSPLGATEADPEDRTSLCGCFDPWPWPAQTPGGPWVMDICREPRSLPLLARSQPGLWATLAVVAPLALLLIPFTGVSRAAPRVGGPMSNPVSRVDAGAASLCPSGAAGGPPWRSRMPPCVQTTWFPRAASLGVSRLTRGWGGRPGGC